MFRKATEISVPVVSRILGTCSVTLDERIAQDGLTPFIVLIEDNLVGTRTAV